MLTSTTTALLGLLLSSLPKLLFQVKVSYFSRMGLVYFTTEEAFL